MVRVKFQTKNIKTGDVYDEDVSVTSLETAEEELKELVEEFNRVEEERYGEEGRPREFVKLLTGDKGQLQHDWDKTDIYSGAYTNYRCKNCRLEREVPTLSPPVGGDCYPERTCVSCNRVFASEKNLLKHKLICDS